MSQDSQRIEFDVEVSGGGVADGFGDLDSDSDLLSFSISNLIRFFKGGGDVWSLDSLARGGEVCVGPGDGSWGRFTCPIKCMLI